VLINNNAYIEGKAAVLLQIMIKKHPKSICSSMLSCYFLRKAYSKVDFGHAKISDTIFWVNPYYYISTTVLKDFTTKTDCVKDGVL